LKGESTTHLGSMIKPFCIHSPLQTVGHEFQNISVLPVNVI